MWGNDLRQIHFSQNARKKSPSILISEDEWLSSFYPDEIMTIGDYLKHSSRLQNIITQHISQLLINNINVVLDYPANTPDQRNWIRTIFMHTKSLNTLHFLDTSNEKCKQQLNQRNLNSGKDIPLQTNSDFDSMTRYFTPPSDDEDFNVIRY